MVGYLGSVHVWLVRMVWEVSWDRDGNGGRGDRGEVEGSCSTLKECHIVIASQC